MHERGTLAVVVMAAAAVFLGNYRTGAPRLHAEALHH
jgi:hypothetical protein